MHVLILCKQYRYLRGLRPKRQGVVRPFARTSTFPVYVSVKRLFYAWHKHNVYNPYRTNNEQYLLMREILLLHMNYKKKTLHESCKEYCQVREWPHILLLWLPSYTVYAPVQQMFELPVTLHLLYENRLLEDMSNAFKTMFVRRHTVLDENGVTVM